MNSRTDWLQGIEEKKINGEMEIWMYSRYLESLRRSELLLSLEDFSVGARVRSRIDTFCSTKL